LEVIAISEALPQNQSSYRKAVVSSSLGLPLRLPQVKKSIDPQPQRGCGGFDLMKR